MLDRIKDNNTNSLHITFFAYILHYKTQIQYLSM